MVTSVPDFTETREELVVDGSLYNVTVAVVLPFVVGVRLTIEV